MKVPISRQQILEKEIKEFFSVWRDEREFDEKYEDQSSITDVPSNNPYMILNHLLGQYIIEVKKDSKGEAIYRTVKEKLNKKEVI